MKATVITIFPEMFPGPLGYSLAGAALSSKKWELSIVNLREFAPDIHQTVDDRPYGGGTGMVMRPDVLGKAIDAAMAVSPGAQLIYMTPRGKPLTQHHVSQLKGTDLVIICGRFEGIDERILDHYRPLEISIGDYVLSGGEVAAIALLDACVRLLPGVIGKSSALEEESFMTHTEFAGLLEYPHYTRPSVWNGMPVPDVLTSGNHAEIRKWRLQRAQDVTKLRRPDLWDEIVDAQGCANKQQEGS